MKALLSLLLVAGGLILATGVASTQAPLTLAQEERSLGPRVAAMEGEMAVLQRENAELRALLDSTVAYLQAQARASEAMLGRLDTSEEQGFTVGINFESRETLMGGFRAFWKSVGTGVPKAIAKSKTPDEEKGPAPPKRRR